MRRCTLGLIAVMITFAALLAPPAFARDAPIGRFGQTLRVEYTGIVADITVNNIRPVPVPPGFGYPPRLPRQEVWRADITVTAVQVPNKYLMSYLFDFRGVTPTGDAYEERHTHATDGLMQALLNAPTGATVNGGVYYDVYRDLVSNMVLMNEETGIRLAQWNQ